MNSIISAKDGTRWDVSQGTSKRICLPASCRRGKERDEKRHSGRNKERIAGTPGIGQGGCKFCGQISVFEVPADWSEEACNELATELCECVGAQDDTRKKRQKEKVEKTIEEQFRETAEHKVQEEVVGLLIDIADAVIEGTIDSGTLDIGNGMKAKIAITAKGLIKVEKTVTKKGTREV